MLNAILQLSEKHGFLNKLVFSKLNIDQLKLGSTGCLLLNKLKNEWFYNIVINKDISVFLLNNEGFGKTFNYAKNMCLERLPFGIAEIIESKKNSTPEDLTACYHERIKEKDTNLEKIFADDDRLTLKCSIFTSGKESIPFFHQWQRQRSTWWRKFSPNPGRYSLTDIKFHENNVQSVQIVAKYPWNSQLVETLTLCPNPEDLSADEMKFKDGRKIVQAHSIVSEIDMTTMFINALCDAYDESAYKGNTRTLFRFHRKLAPYSISFAVSGATTSVISELNDLALYLTKQLRTNHVSTLLLPSSSKWALESQWKQYDELGVPYNVLLNEGTLRDGIVQLRSRDTTLKEQVHVTNLVTYVEQLFKNY